MSKQSVEDVWAQLKSKSTPKKQRTKKDIAEVKLPLSSRNAKEAPRCAQEGVKEPKTWPSQLDEDMDTNSGVAHARGHGGLECGGDAGMYLAGIQRHINCLSDPDRSIRRNAVVILSKKLLHGDNSTPAASQEILQEVFRTSMLQSTIALLSDPTEKCREASLQLLGAALRKVPDPGPLSAALFPAVAARMGKLPVQEGTEELRLALVQLVEGPLIECTGTSLIGYLDELSLHLCRAMEDPYHEVKKYGSAAIAKSCLVLPPSALQPKSGELVKSVIAALTHQHSRVRIASLKALDALVLSGVSAGVIEEVIAPGLVNIVVDQSPAVREMCFEFLAGWLGGNRSEASLDDLPPGVDPLSNAKHLLPLMLLGITDEESNIRCSCLRQVEAVGSLFCRKLDSSPSIDNGGESSAMDIVDEDMGLECSSTADHSLVDILGAPFEDLPSRHAQSMIVHLLPQMVPRVLQSLQSWSHNERLNASRVLESILCFAQSGCVTQLEQLLPAICGAIADENTQITGRIMHTIHILGASIPVPEWLHLALDFLLSPRNGPSQKASALVVVSGLLYSGSICNGRLEDKDVKLLVDGLRKEEIRCCDHTGMRMQLTAVAANLINLAGPACQRVSLALYHLLLQLVGCGVGTLAVDSLVSLATSCEYKSPQDFADQHGQDILQLCLQNSEKWIESSPNYQVFGSLLKWSSQKCLLAMMSLVADAIHGIVSNHERDPALRISSLRLMDDLLEDSLLSLAFGGENARQTLAKLLLPAIVWRAGKTAAAVRFAAATALVTFFSGDLIQSEPLADLLESGEVLPLVFQLLEEDHYADTRISACYVMTRIISTAGGNLRDEERRMIYPELLKRLDDSSNQVRIAVCASLKAFVRTMPTNYCETNTSYLLAPMLIHMDDSLPEIQEAVYDVVLSLTAKKPKVVVKEISKIQNRFRSKQYCEQILMACKENSELCENESGNQDEAIFTDSTLVSEGP